jgi:Skp family chaperone for outer membrane proteins
MPKKKAAKKKTSPKKTAERQPAAHADHSDDITLDAVEAKAFELAQSSAKVQSDLEQAVTEAMAKAVRKVFKDHGLSLTADQGLNMAMVLFGD